MNDEASILFLKLLLVPRPHRRIATLPRRARFDHLLERDVMLQDVEPLLLQVAQVAHGPALRARIWAFN
ncbi:hypothetical protein A9K66_27925 [Mesorhizobium sp. AA23]|nr:hypothetical protein A9K66_27925 [Mesorhizobium sp. AA23]